MFISNFKYLLCLTLPLISIDSIAAGNCQSQYDALKHLRSKMRAGYTVSEGEYLRDRERDIKEQIRLCKKISQQKTNVVKIAPNVSSKKQYVTSDIYVPNKDQLGRQSLSLKGKFEGAKQQAWLDSYQTPKECLKPKTTAMFAKCLSVSDAAAEKFSQKWKQSPPTLITKKSVAANSAKDGKNNAQQRALDLNRATCVFWKEKYKQDPNDLNKQEIMELECKKTSG